VYVDGNVKLKVTRHRFIRYYLGTVSTSTACRAVAEFILDLRPWDHITAALLRFPTTYYVQVLHLDARCHIQIVLTYLQHVVVALATLPGLAHLHSADCGQYTVRRVLSLVGSRAFSVAVSKSFNRLFALLRDTVYATTFKKHLKNNTLYRGLPLVTILFSVQTHFVFYCSIPLSICCKQCYSNFLID